MHGHTRRSASASQWRELDTWDRHVAGVAEAGREQLLALEVDDDDRGGAGSRDPIDLDPGAARVSTTPKATLRSLVTAPYRGRSSPSRQRSSPLGRPRQGAPPRAVQQKREGQAPVARRRPLATEP